MDDKLNIFINYNSLNIRKKIAKNYFISNFLLYINTVLNKKKETFFLNEKKFQSYLKEEIQKWLISLEEYNNVIEEEILIWKKRMDLSFNIWDEYIWIELKNWIKWNAMRTLEYQVNEYIEKGIIYNFIFIIIKIKYNDKNELNRLINYIPLFERLIKKEKVILLLC